MELYNESVIYTGESRSWVHDFFNVEDRLSLQDGLGNAAFLQMIAVPPYGSNTPLWSLSFEWWYYILFPLGWIAISKATRVDASILYLFLFAVTLYAVGKDIAVYFPIWLMGALVAMLPRTLFLKRIQSPLLGLL